MALRTGVVLVVATAAAGFEYDENAAAADIWVNQAMDCAGVEFDGADLSQWNCGLSCDKVPLTQVHPLINRTLKTYGIAAMHGNECLLALRGTKDPMNVLSDVNIQQINPWEADCPKCKVHMGFYNTWDSVKPQAREAFDSMGCTTLRVTGHSLGASMAALAAYEMAQWYQISAVYTYGQPRTGNSQWVGAFSDRMAGVPYFRVTDYKDPIPHLLLHNMFFQGWEHQVPEVYYHATHLGAYTICNDDPRSTACSSQWSVADTSAFGCFHCSYLGLNPCSCNVAAPQCTVGGENLV